VKQVLASVVMAVTVAALVFGGLAAPTVWAGPEVCNCPHAGDASGDGSLDLLDVVYIIEGAFNGGPVFWDPDCPKSRSDWNADGILDVRDICAASDHIFMGGLAPINPCDCLINPPLCAVVVDPNPGGSGNTVVVESKMAFAGQTGVPIGIKLTNLVHLRYVVVPLVARSINPGSFITAVKMSFADRLAGSLLDDVRSRNQYADPDGTCNVGGFGTITWCVKSNNPYPSRSVDASPEGFLFVAGTFFSGMEFDPGSDATGSLVLTVDVTSTFGSFEIDTTCTDPANHLEFIQGNPLPNMPIVPAFTKGIITIVPNTPPIAQCQNVSVSAAADCTADASVDNGSYDPDGGPVTVVQTPLGPYPLGITPVTIVVTDAFLAADTCEATVTVIDDTPPVITCPDSLFVGIGPEESGAVVNYTCTAADNCPGVTVACTPPSGSFFPRGFATVTCIATDAANLADTCQFSVNVFTLCFDRLSDVNCDGVVDVFDIMLLIDISFNGAEQVPCPGPK
jgi:hypothetical protein